MKYILVTGGILSGLGKGVIASSAGTILQALGYRVTSIKIDPYLNCDAGTMNPFEHGEVFVLNDGGEVDLDLGNYERFMSTTLTRDNNITTGKIYRQVIEQERRGEFLGKTVQVVPHICNAIQDWVERVALIPVDGSPNPAQICLIELGGTVGDIESGPFIEAMRQFQFRVGQSNFAIIHVSLVPELGVVGEQKTKPTQQSVRTLFSLGLTPDVIACRSSKPLTLSTKQKISSFCHVKPTSVIGVHDVSNIFKVPLLLESQKLASILVEKLQLAPLPHDTLPYLKAWKEISDGGESLNNPQRATQTVTIALVGKYTNFSDSYLSVVKALQHSCIKKRFCLVINWIESTSLEEEHQTREVLRQEKLGKLKRQRREAPHTNGHDCSNGENNRQGDHSEQFDENNDTSEGEETGEKEQSYSEAWRLLGESDGILVPGGFGERGIEGKIAAANYARVNNIPFLGICLGMQIAVIEFARSVLGWTNANSTEFDKETPFPVVIEMPEFDKTHKGGTMRLGARRSKITAGSRASTIYGGASVISERHRHRWEVNPEYVSSFVEKGLHFTATDFETGNRMEIAELKDADFFFCTQFHPEFLSRPLNPSPPFFAFITQSAERSLRTNRKANKSAKRQHE